MTTEGLAPDYYTPTEVARLLGVSTRTVAAWCEQGRLPYTTTPSGRKRIPTTAVKGGRAFDAQLHRLRSRMADRTLGQPEPTDEELADQVLERRDAERAERRRS